MTLPWNLPFVVGGSEVTEPISPELAFIKSQIPENAEDYGFTDEVLQSMLDAGISATKIILSVWTGVAAQTYSMVDVQESGSSRNLSTIHNNALAMANFWKEKADKEDAATADPNDKPRGRIAFHTATRV